MLKVAALSDIHGYYEEIEDMPHADLLILAGDLLKVGTYANLFKLNSWIGMIKQKYKYGVLAIGGNHDTIMEENPSLVREILSNMMYCIDEEVVIAGKRIYLTPWVPTYGTWSFMKSEKDLEKVYSRIPNGLDLLVCHGMPYKINDLTMRGKFHVGSVSLAEAISRAKPKNFIGGHIHGWSQFTQGTTTKPVFNKDVIHRDGCRHMNVSVLNEDYSAEFPVTLFDI